MRRVVYKALGLFVLFIVILGGYGGYRYGKLSAEQEDTATNLIQEATIPVVHTTYEGTPITTLQGYTMDMKLQYMRGPITVLGAGRDLEILVDRYDNHITGLSLEVMEMDGTVIDSYIFPAWEKTDTGISALTTLSEEIGSTDDYMLCIYISTETQDKLRYYSVLRYSPDSEITSQIAFVKDFSNKTFDKEQAKELIPYMEPSAGTLNNNLGHVDITASFNQLTWDDFKLERIGEPEVMITDVKGKSASYVLSYDGQTTSEDGVLEYYHVKEFYRVCYNGERVYLIAFDRTMDQVYNPVSGNVSTNRMNLGIDSDLQVTYKASPNNKYIAFVKERQLWLMDIAKNQITCIFTFYDEAHNDTRDRWADHDIQIVNVKDDGHVDFLVYGYLNRGVLEGKNGVVLYAYNLQDNQVDELIYLPSDRSYAVLKESIGQICYKTEQFLYIYLDHSIYCVDLQGKSYVQMIPSLLQDGYCTNDTGQLLAWTDSLEPGNSIRIKNLENGNDQVMEGSKNEIQIPLGFIGEDFAYGTVKKGNVVEINGNQQVLISTITIVDQNNNVLKEYKKKNQLITNCKATASMLQFELVKKKTDNGTVTIAIQGKDQILSNQEQVETGVALDTIATDARQTELILTYANAVISAERTAVRTPEAIRMNSANALTIKETQVDDKNFYIYGVGELKGATVSLAAAQKQAESWKGFVTDSSNQVIWSYQETFK